MCIHSMLDRLKTEGIVDFFQFIKSSRIHRAGLVAELVHNIHTHIKHVNTHTSAHCAVASYWLFPNVIERYVSVCLSETGCQLLQGPFPTDLGSGTNRLISVHFV